MNKVYLGDGVYASEEDFPCNIKLTTKRYTEEHYIYLEPEVMEALITFYNQLKALKEHQS